MGFKQALWNVYKNKLKSSSRAERYSFVFSNLVLIVTSRCNFYCQHCLRDLNNTKDLPFEIAQKAVLGAKKYNFNNVCLTGGEPLLYPRLKELVEFVVSQGLSFNVITNGFVFKEFADFFKKYRERMVFVGFSLESATAAKHDTIRHKGSFKVLLENFTLCRDARIPFRIITAASTMNHEEMFDIALLAKKKGASALVVTTVLPCPRSNDNKLVLGAREREELFVGLRQLSKTLKFPILIGADIRANNNIRLCNNLNLTEVAVDMDGNIVQCCELANYDNDVLQGKAVIASLKNSSFEDGLKAISQHVHKFVSMRIDDYRAEADTEAIDFNSCFYCVKNLPRL